MLRDSPIRFPRAIAALLALPFWCTPLTFAQVYRVSTVVGPSVLTEGSSAATQPFPRPGGVAVDASGNMYVAAPDMHKVYKITSAGRVTTFAGNGQAGPAGDGGPAVSAQLANPNGVAVSSAGTVYIADSGNNRVRAVSSDGVIRAVAGTVATATASDSAALGDNSPAASARLSYPVSVAVDEAGNI